MIASPMISPPDMSRLRRIRSGKTRIPEKSAIMRERTSPTAAHDPMTARFIIKEVVRSASCSVCIASNASGTRARTSAAPATMSWEKRGFRFCGMVLLPTVPSETGSSTSPNSCFISVYTSRPILLQVAASIPISVTYSAIRSPMLRAGIDIGPRPSISPILLCVGMPLSPSDPRVPAAPPSIATKTRPSHPRSLSTWRHSSSIHTATFSPKVAGTACWPCVRPGR